MVKKLILIFLCAGLCAGCGRFSRPVSPENATYPQTYVVKL